MANPKNNGGVGSCAQKTCVGGSISPGSSCPPSKCGSVGTNTVTVTPPTKPTPVKVIKVKPLGTPITQEHWVANSSFSIEPADKKIDFKHHNEAIYKTGPAVARDVDIAGDFCKAVNAGGLCGGIE